MKRYRKRVGRVIVEIKTKREYIQTLEQEGTPESIINDIRKQPFRYYVVVKPEHSWTILVSRHRLLTTAKKRFNEGIKLHETAKRVMDKYKNLLR